MSHGSLGSTTVYLFIHVYYIQCILYYIILYSEKPHGRTLRLQKPKTEKLAQSQSSSCLFRHSTACSCGDILTPSPITWLLTLFPEETLPQILHIFSFPHPERCGMFCYLLHESRAVRAGFISEVVNVVLLIPIVTECFSHARIFATPLSPSPVTPLGPNPSGRLLPSTLSHAPVTQFLM